MAKASIRLPEEFLLQLSRLEEQTDEIIPRVLEAGGNVVLDKVRSNLDEVIGSNTKNKSRSTGQLKSALGLSPAKIDRNGNANVKIGFAEPRSDGVSNAMIANTLEYGKHGQPPKPFLKPAVTATKAACLEAMRNKFSEEVEGI